MTNEAKTATIQEPAIFYASEAYVDMMNAKTESEIAKAMNSQTTKLVLAMLAGFMTLAIAVYFK